jgi:hypothetical protein
MKLNIGEAQFHRFADDVNHLYPQVLWEVEIEDDRDLTDELTRPDIWNTAAVLQGTDRATYNRTSDSLNEFCNQFAFCKEQVLHTAYHADKQIFNSSWYRDYEYYLKNSQFGIAVFKDMPGFSMNPHLDNNHIMVQLVINLTDNCASTKFYPFNSQEPFYTSSTKKYQGIMFLNTPGAVHDIADVAENRYILYSSVVFDIY